MVPEARLEDSGSGLVPADDGWFAVNVRDAQWIDGRERRAPNGLYHAENQQEDFLVLSGECRLIVEDEERLLGPWDFVHCPPRTHHVFVGAGDGPCAILMMGARLGEEQLHYPVSELAARYGASVEAETTEFAEVYPRFAPSRPERPSCWNDLPWTAP
jgi:mannose-6-phosphate isomerase-like protein (cupin superfamily)